MTMMNRAILTKLFSFVTPVALLSAAVLAGAAENHPFPQPRVGLEDPSMDAERTISEDGMTTYWKTAKTHFPPSKPFQDDKPSNLLDTVYELGRDSGGDLIPNTLPSTPEQPYNLHPEPVVEDIDPRSPRWDLGVIINDLRASVDPHDRRATNREVFPGGIGVPADPRRGRIDRKENEGPGIIEERATPRIDYEAVQFGIDILEGNPIDREYSGMPLLHYMGPIMVKKVDPETNSVTVRQAWTRTYLKSDTMFIDPTTIPPDEEWTIRYEISALHWGHEDFAPFVVLFDDPEDVGLPNLMHMAFDQTFFPMEEGKKYTFEIKMPPHRYWNLTYHWGWRVHPPRIQAIEKAVKAPMGKTLVQWEADVFGENPRASEEAKLEAIGMISDLAPAKRMWKALKAIKATQKGGRPRPYLIALVGELEAAFEDWKDRTKLPRGVEEAEGFDQTIVYLNSHLYGGMHKVLTEAEESWSEWQTRGAELKTKIYNGDYFPHAYMNVDFGGRRGWANIFQNTIPIGGQGPWFTFGRAHLSRNLQIGTQPMPVLVPAAERPSEQNLPPGMMHLGKAGKPKQDKSVPALPPATEKAMRSEWMPHPYPPGEEIKIYRNGRGLGEHNVVIEYRYEPSQRLRFYQFDPLHHNENILSIH